MLISYILKNTSKPNVNAFELVAVGCLACWSKHKGRDLTATTSSSFHLYHVYNLNFKCITLVDCSNWQQGHDGLCVEITSPKWRSKYDKLWQNFIKRIICIYCINKNLHFSQFLNASSGGSRGDNLGQLSPPNVRAPLWYKCAPFWC